MVIQNNAYIAVLTSDSYVFGAKLLKASLDRVNTRFPLYVLVTEDVSEGVRADLTRLGINILPIDKIPLPANIYEHNKAINPNQAKVWEYALSKFQVLNMTQFEKVILIDLDICVLKNLDHCFNLPHMTAALDGELFNLWPNWPHFNSGFLVLEPNPKVFDDILRFTKNLNPESPKDAFGKPYILADQEIWNLYYSDWKNHPELHLNKYYNIFAPHSSKLAEDEILSNGYFIHYVGAKPWAVRESGNSITIAHHFASARPTGVYAIANAILGLYVKYDGEVDWKEIEDGGEFDYQMALSLSKMYMDYKTAKLYADKAAEKNEMYKSFVDSIKAVERAALHKELLLPVIREMYNELSTSGMNSINMYFDLEKLNALDDISVDTAEIYWNALKGMFLR